MTTKGEVVVPSFTGPALGRPRSELVAASTPAKPVGRPPGEAARMAEFKSRVMGTAGTRIIDKMVRIALDDTHPDQTAMLKFVGSRLLPEVAFGGIKAGTGGMSVHFHMMGPTGGSQGEVIDVPVVIRNGESGE